MTSLEEMRFLEERLKIDEPNLDQEIIEQPELYYLAATECANAISARDGYKEELKNLSAELSNTYRIELDKQGKKITESLITSCIERDPEYKELKIKYLESSSLVESLEALKESFSLKAWMLRSLCDMKIAGLTATTSVRSSSANKVSEEAAMRVRKAVAEKRNSRSNV